MKQQEHKCKRCGFENSSGKYGEGKKLICPVCNYVMYRIKPVYKETLREQYICTNDNCYVRMTVITIRQKNRSMKE